MSRIGIMELPDRHINNLHDENAQLEKNSTNSSKPPKPRKDKSRRRKIGTQKGHKQHLRTFGHTADVMEKHYRMHLYDDFATC